MSVPLFGLLKQCGIPHDPSRLADFEVGSVTQDSRRAGPGSVFVAMKGSKADGNAFAADAAGKGAGLIIVEDESAPQNLKAPVLKVQNTRKIYSILNHVFFGKPSESMKMVGVTGTNGKTTSTYILHAIVSAREKAGLLGTIHYFFGTRSVPATHTTPDSADLHRLFSEMREGGCRTVVMEASSHALNQERLAGIRFDAALFTNLTRDHLDYHKTMEEYFEAKAKLFGLLKEGGAAVLNADDPYGVKLKSRVKKSLTYAVDGPADFRAVDVKADLAGSAFNIAWQGKKTPVRTPLFGKHNLYNILGAMVTAHSLGIPLEESARVIGGFKGVPGRLERVDAGQDFFLFVDYAHTDDGLINVLSALRPFAKRDLIVLFGCGGDRDRGKRPKMAQAAEKYADFVVLTSDNPRFEDPQAILKEVSAGFSKGYVKFETHPDRKKAIRRVLLKARKGDVVLLAGKGHEDYQVIKDQKVPFSDKEEALRVLNGV